MEGCREFLQALGFVSVMIPVEGQGKLILFLINRCLCTELVIGVLVLDISQSATTATIRSFKESTWQSQSAITY